MRALIQRVTHAQVDVDGRTVGSIGTGLLILLGVFVIAYFKFTWALRQFNLLSITLGAVPQEGEAEELENHAQKFAAVNSCAGNDFNRGLRAYYFGMAVMSLMVSPWLFILTTIIIVIVLARREFYSPVLKALTDTEERR